MAGSILLIGTTVGCDMQQDRSTGWRLGTNRVVQFRYQVAGVLMGAAIPVMHYVGMAAVSFTPAPLPQSELAHAINISQLGLAVSVDCGPSRQRIFLSACSL